jgi:hypothetical protein
MSKGRFQRVLSITLSKLSGPRGVLKMQEAANTVVHRHHLRKVVGFDQAYENQLVEELPMQQGLHERLFYNGPGDRVCEWINPYLSM